MLERQHFNIPKTVVAIKFDNWLIAKQRGMSDVLRRVFSMDSCGLYKEKRFKVIDNVNF